jgi:DNA-binding MarR family transcriptional regulator
MRIVSRRELPFSAGPMARAPDTEIPDRSTDPDAEVPLTADYYFYLVFQAARQRDLFCDRVLKPIGLNVAKWRSLAIIRRLEVCTMTALARYSTVERTTLTRAVDQLVGHGLVARAVPERDRRQVNLSLTEAGEESYRQAVAILFARNQEILAEVSSDRLRDANQVLRTTLEKLVGNAALAADLTNFGRFALDSEP